MENKYVQKICLIGPPSVGKTSLIRKYVLDVFDDKYITTVGTKVTKRNIVLDGPNEKRIDMRLMIWDISGQKKTEQAMTMYLRGSKGALAVCDLTRKDTITKLKESLDVVRSVAGDIPIIVLGNKCDLTDEIHIELPELKSAFERKDLKVPVCLTSAKTGENVDDSFRALAITMFKNTKKNFEEGEG